MDEAEEYLNKNIKSISGEMLRDLLDVCPENPKAFMINWLAKRLNFPLQICQERIELEKLRKEEEKYLDDNNSQLKKILKNKETNGLKIEVPKNMSEKSVFIKTDGTHIKKDQNKNFKRTMTPAFKGGLFKSNLKDKNEKLKSPNEQKQFITEELEETENENDEEQELEKEHEQEHEKEQEQEQEQKQEANDSKEESESESEDEDEEKDIVGELIQNRIKAVANRGQRSSVSAEAYGMFNIKAVFVPKIIPKSKEQKERIYNKIIQSFLFNCLEENDLNTVIDAMEERRYQENDYVIKQGENGSVLYLVESGELDCYKKFVNEPNPKFLKSYHSGEAFGELALLYNVPRAASIIAKTECILWDLDRETFNNIVKQAAMKKREKYENFLKSVEILATVDPYELSQISDAIQVMKVKQDEYIIRENEPGDKFFILEEGEAIAEKIFFPGGSPEKVKEYSKGQYFGELALIRNAPRAASVKAIVKLYLYQTDCRLLTLDRTTFKRLLGPIENILSRNSTFYTKYFPN